jgi:hypothetical protein
MTSGADASFAAVAERISRIARDHGLVGNRR